MCWRDWAELLKISVFIASVLSVCVLYDISLFLGSGYGVVLSPVYIRLYIPLTLKRITSSTTSAVTTISLARSTVA